MSANVSLGLYRNKVGAELRVTGIAMSLSGYNTLGGDIAIAEEANPSWRYKTWLVTETSLREAGYEPVEPAQATADQGGESDG